MKRSYFIGLSVSLAVALGTIGVKAAFTKYPGIGDFLLFSQIVELLPRRAIDGIYSLDLDLRVVAYIAKAAFAAVFFTLLHLALSKRPRLQSPVSIGCSIVALTAMSLGEAVVA